MPTAEGYEPTATRSYGLRLKAFREETREADFIASTAAEDSYDEVVEQVWDLKRFRSNPVALWAHNSRELPIGGCTRCEVVKQEDGSDALECTIQFATEDMNPKAEQVFRMVRGKMLRAVSVGFNPRSYRYEKRDGREILILSDNELFEISVCAIPANAEALAKMRAKAREEADAARVAGKVEQTMKTIEEMQKALDESNAAKLAAEGRAVAAEKAALDAKSAVDATLKDHETVKVSLKAVEDQNKILAAERDAHVQSDAAVRKACGATAASADGATKAETTLEAVNRVLAGAKASEEKALGEELKNLVGVKILPNEVESMTELAKTNRPLFDKMMSQRGVLKILKSVMTPDPVAKNAVASGDSNGSDLAAEALKNAETTNAASGGDLGAAALDLAHS